MTVVIPQEVAKAVVLAELNRQASEPKAWAEMHLLCAIEASGGETTISPSITSAP